MKRTPAFNPQPPFFPLPLDGGGKGEGDNILNFDEFQFHYPSPRPSPPRGEGVSGSIQLKELFGTKKRNIFLLSLLSSVPSVV